MRIKAGSRVMCSLLVLCMGLAAARFIPAQETKPQVERGAVPSQRGGFMQIPLDPRVQLRSYLFKHGDVSRDIEYAVFVSSRVTRDKASPLIITLHGLGVGPAIMFGRKALELAEEGGYVLVGPMGFNERGWYGITMRGFGPPKTSPKAPDPQDAAKPDSRETPKPKPSMFSNPDDPPNLNELSEMDVMNVLDRVRKEFNIDERRIYLMGHSMGGAGTLHLGVKYPSIWAALAPIAPAAFALDPDSLKAIPNMPIIIVQGDADKLVPAANTRRWVEKLRELNMTYEYHELPGVDHGPVIEQALPMVYAFFSKHAKR